MVHTVLQLEATYLQVSCCFRRVSLNAKCNILPVHTAEWLNIPHLPQFIVKIQCFNTVNIQVKQWHHSIYLCNN